MKIFFITITSLYILAAPVFASSSPSKHIHPEKTYQNAWCNSHNGKQEVILKDKARVDCVTDTHAIEFDFAYKWGESIGQALYYATRLNKKPGIVLITEDVIRDQKYVDRVNAVAEKYGISVWTTEPS